LAAHAGEVQETGWLTAKERAGLDAEDVHEEVMAELRDGAWR
jgi:hypothetical protein